MIVPFQSVKNHKPVAKAVHVFDEASSARWVPLNKSFITLTKLILRTAAERLGVASIAITLRCINHQGYRHLVLASNEKDLHITALGAVEEFIISTEMPIHLQNDSLNTIEAVTVAINYKQQRLGYIVAKLFETSEYCDALSLTTLVTEERKITADLAVVASDIMSIIRRYETRYRAIFIYGDQCYWLGNSSALRQLEQRIDQLTYAIHPILIRGNKGTGKNIAARTLHCLRYASILPFIESSCNEWQEGAAASILQALYTYAKGGTLFLRNVDKLSAANFQALEDFWLTRNSELADLGLQEAVGLVFSVSQYNFVAIPELSAWLKRSCIELGLPNLSERREDIRDLACFFMHEYALSIEFDFTEEAWQLLDNFSWRGNAEQLKNVIREVALRVDKSLVTADILNSFLKI